VTANGVYYPGFQRRIQKIGGDESENEVAALAK